MHPAGQSLLAEIAALSVVRGFRIACAESITAGLVQSLLASQSGASQWFAGGVTAYNLDQKVTLLRVDRDHACACNCVSQRVADEMAMNCRRLFAVDIAIATTGYAEPHIATGIRQPFAILSLATRVGIQRQIEVELTADDRQGNQHACAWAAVEMLAAHTQTLDA